MFSAVDWALIAAYLVLTFAVGLITSRSASRSLTSYFAADRSLPWWWLGTSMAATTFAADTPLAVTGIVARDGIAGNWFLWCSIFTYITIAVFFARKWRRSRVLTDVEIIELRYGGRSAGVLRAFKAFYFSIVINSVVLGWVFRAMSKISRPFISWSDLLGAESFSRLETLWPRLLIFDDLNNTLTVLAILVIVTAYSSLGGIRGVILTDLFQFALAVTCAVLLAVMAVQYVGGLETLFSELYRLYPDRAGKLLRLRPDFRNGLLPFNVFIIYVGLLWWAQYFSDGSGYIAQRINTARTPAEAEKGTLWFTLATFVLRTWPWILVALAALVVFPLDEPARYHRLGAQVAGDREMGYPVMMKLVLPSGLLGLTFVSLMAAFMSTVDTHINWAASYLVNDIYGRFLRPGASQKQLVAAGRVCVVLIAVLSVAAASQITSIERAWKFFVAIGAGMGLPQILRWVWWRANAWTEIAGMVTAFTLAVLLYSLFPQARDEYLLAWIIAAGAGISLAVTLLTPPADSATLKRFAERVRPFGFWRAVPKTSRDSAPAGRYLVQWLLGVTAVFSGMFGIGYLLMSSPLSGLGSGVLCLVCLGFYLRNMSKD